MRKGSYSPMQIVLMVTVSLIIAAIVVIVTVNVIDTMRINRVKKVIDNTTRETTDAQISTVKTNMHIMQITVEGISVDSSGVYTRTPSAVEAELPSNMENPFTHSTFLIDGGGVWVFGRAPDSPGVISYEPSKDGRSYVIRGYGKDGLLDFELKSYE